MLLGKQTKEAFSLCQLDLCHLIVMCHIKSYTVNHKLSFAHNHEHILQDKNWFLRRCKITFKFTDQFCG